MKTLRFSAKIPGLLVACAMAASSIPPTAAESAPAVAGASPVEWSQRMAASEMTRRGRTLMKDGSDGARWDYTSGLLALALLRLADATDDKATAEYGAAIVESFIDGDGAIATYDPEEFNIDMVTPGKVVLLRYEQTGEARLERAAERLRAQLAKQPRTSEGGFWHKQRYPQQMWLDGLYMGAPFYAHYGKVFGEPAVFDDVARQILLIDRHLHDPNTGLYYHAWDEDRRQSWADPVTGCSPNFWGRAIGWYAMAIVDCLDFIPPTQTDVEEINAVLRRVADGIARWQDPATGLWWQVVDQGAREGNYLEATASSMFVYALAKGINRGYLSREAYGPVVRKAYEGILRDFIRTNADGTIDLTHCCSVAGLGYTNSAGRARDGSFEYYVSEPVIDNDLKGVGPFILAGLEMQELLADRPVRITGRGWSDVDAILARIRAPEFPARDFVITDFGAKVGTDVTGAIRAAIAACNAAGGGRVVVPEGTWPTGAIHLESNVNLHVSTGATLRFSTDPAAYLPAVYTRWEGVECMNYSPLIYAFEQENVAITGGGTLDGQADWTNWWAWNNKKEPPVKQKGARARLMQMGEDGVSVEQRVFGEGSYLRPMFIQPYRCRNVLIEGVKIVGSPMWEIHPVLCTNVTVRGVTVISHGTNNDGCNPESSRDVLIENCVFDTGDDCIAIKSGRNNDGRRIGVRSENIVIRGCTMRDGHGGVVLGSEISGGAANVFIENCTMDSPNLDRALRFKSNARRGGVVENIFMRDVRVGRVAEAVVTIDFLYEEGAEGSFPPTVRNVQLERVTSTDSPRVLFIAGFPGATIDGIRLRECTFENVTDASVVLDAGSILFDRVNVVPAKGRGEAKNRVSAPDAK